MIISNRFGEISVIYECKRTASVIAKNYCTCSMIKKEHFEEVIQFSLDVMQNIKEEISHYKDIQR